MGTTTTMGTRSGGVRTVAPVPLRVTCHFERGELVDIEALARVEAERLELAQAEHLDAGRAAQAALLAPAIERMVRLGEDCRRILAHPAAHRTAS